MYIKLTNLENPPRGEDFGKMDKLLNSWIVIEE